MTCVYKKYEVTRKMVKEHMTTTKTEISGGGMNLRGRGRSLVGVYFQVRGMRADIWLLGELPPTGSHHAIFFNPPPPPSKLMPPWDTPHHLKMKPPHL